uniref:LuxR C-terminal-related transcriptional regulator n=1 Tax=Kocuria marina TaxID=223184 RepID=UPI00346046EC
GVTLPAVRHDLTSLTARTPGQQDDSHNHRTYQTGSAHGFLPKSTPSEKLAQVVRDIAAGKQYVDPEIAASALSGSACPLSDRELDVLRESAQQATLADAAAALHLAPGTVRNYVSSALAKLRVSTRQEAVQRAWDEGWI